MAWIGNLLKKSPVTLTQEQINGPLYDLPCPRTIEDTPFDMHLLNGKVAIISNTASLCGFTDRHYKEFQDLYESYHDKGLEILGFPCKQFSNQEHSDVCKIKDKAKSYNVTFPLFETITVNGEGTTPLFQWLKLKSGKFGGPKTVSAIGWNFGKFLIDKEGKVLGYFGPNTNPLKMKPEIEKALAA